MNDKKQWGGKRQGAGRPTQLTNPKRITIWLESWQIERLKKLDKSEIIRNLLTEYFERNPTNDIL